MLLILELTFPVLFWLRLPSVPISTFLVLLLSGLTVVGSCLLHRSSESLEFKSSSATLVLHTACSIKLYSSAAFRIFRPQDLQTRSERFSSLVILVETQSSHNTQLKSARHFLLGPMAKKGFQMTLFLLQK